MPAPKLCIGGQRNNTGCLGCVVCFAFVIFIASVYIRGCNTPYYKAKQLAKSDPYAAAEMMAKEIRADYRDSIDSVLLLASIRDRRVLPVLVGLMDLPDGRWTGRDARSILFDSIRNLTADIAMRPEYDPAAEGGIRFRQKQAWLQWLRANGFESVLPETRRATSKPSD
jgi:hypothetical protein